tara:strand:- start:163 stop:873 length:711 start_codon:yes stop_codon:yes gene_type:complete
LRKILITGASRGIGEAIALKCLYDGHKVSLGIRDLESFKKSKISNLYSNKNNLITNYYDALNKESSNSYVENTVNEFGGIDTLILCAGIFKNTELIFPDNKIGEIEELWETNVLAPWLLTKKAWKYLKDSGIGRIQVLVSMSGKRSKGNLAGYTMSKFALMGLCQTMRNEGWESGIRVTAICPGWVNTNMSSKITAISKEAMTQPNDIATLSSTLLNLPNSSVPFEISINCNLEKT